MAAAAIAAVSVRRMFGANFVSIVPLFFNSWVSFSVGPASGPMNTQMFLLSVSRSFMLAAFCFGEPMSSRGLFSFCFIFSTAVWRSRVCVISGRYWRRDCFAALTAAVLNFSRAFLPVGVLTV